MLAPSEPREQSNCGWKFEELITDASSLAKELKRQIDSATRSIDLETYIYFDDDYGQEIADRLIRASLRGVAVRVSVDGVGSSGWIYTIGAKLRANNIEVKVFHQLPWEHLLSERKGLSSRWMRLFALLNKRNHRKVCIFDGRRAWVSSSNIWITKEEKSGHPWHETGIIVEGDEVELLSAAFDLSWYSRLHGRRQREQAKRRVRESLGSLVRLNNTIKLRAGNYRGLLRMLLAAKSRIWITNPYFVPTERFMKALASAVKRGVDVRLMSSSKSDIFFMPWIASVFHYLLLEAGVKLYSYQPAIVHSKYMIIDGCILVGSSNINQRSLRHDLEADVLSRNPKTVELLAQQFQSDLEKCKLLKIEDSQQQVLWKKILGRFLLLFKYYL